MPIKKRAVLTNKICVKDGHRRSFFFQVLLFIAITIQPIIAASNKILTTSNGNAYPCSVVLNICVPILQTLAFNAGLLRLI